MKQNLNLSMEALHMEPEKAKNSYLCRSFKIFPEGKEAFGGFLFGIIEMRATPPEEANIIITTLMNTLREDYYRQVLASPDPQKLNIETIFEFALNKTNQKLIELIQIGQIKFIKENLNYLIGIAKPNKDQTIDLYFTNQGAIKAYLLYKNKKNTFSIINLLGQQTINHAQTNNRAKIFSSITSGQLKSTDFFIICTEFFSNFISPSKIQHVLTNNPLSEAINYFRNIIKTANLKSDLTHSAIVVAFDEKQLPGQAPRSEDSLNELLSTTTHTEKLLAPSFTLNIKKNIKSLFQRSASGNKHLKPKSSTKTATTLDSEIDSASKKKPTWPLFIASFFKNCLLVFSGRGKTSISQIKSSVDNLQEKQSGSSFNFSKYRKYILLTLILLVIIFSASMMWAKNQHQIKQEQEQYAQQLQSVKNIINDAETNYIYKDTEQSLINIEKALKELNYLPQATPEQISNYKDIEKQINDLKNKLFSIEKIVPQKIIDLTQDDQEMNAEKILLTGNSLYIYGNGGNAAQANIEEKTVEDIIINDKNIINSASEEGNQYFIDDDNIFYSIKNNKFASTSFKVTNAPDDFAVYNSHLYLLYNTSQQINKHRSSGNSFGSAQAWIQDRGKADLTTATSFDIDGAIYVLNKDGKINKFYAGNFENFNNPTIEPAITDAQKIITSVDNDKLFVFEPSSNRIIIISKNGGLVKQLIFDSLKKIDDITINNNGTKGYLLSDNNIYQFNI